VPWTLLPAWPFEFRHDCSHSVETFTERIDGVGQGLRQAVGVPTTASSSSQMGLSARQVLACGHTVKAPFLLARRGSERRGCDAQVMDLTSYSPGTPSVTRVPHLVAIH
jgi:hypothetical protein